MRSANWCHCYLLHDSVNSFCKSLSPTKVLTIMGTLVHFSAEGHWGSKVLRWVRFALRRLWGLWVLLIVAFTVPVDRKGKARARILQEDNCRTSDFGGFHPDGLLQESQRDCGSLSIQSATNVLCGHGEGLWLCPPGYLVGVLQKYRVPPRTFQQAIGPLPILSAGCQIISQGVALCQSCALWLFAVWFPWTESQGIVKVWSLEASISAFCRRGGSGIFRSSDSWGMVDCPLQVEYCTKWRSSSLWVRVRWSVSLTSSWCCISCNFGALDYDKKSEMAEPGSLNEFEMRSGAQTFRSCSE